MEHKVDYKCLEVLYGSYEKPCTDYGKDELNKRCYLALSNSLS